VVGDGERRRLRWWSIEQVVRPILDYSAKAALRRRSVEIDGSTTTVVQGKRIVAVYGSAECDVDSARAALARANTGLDYLSMQGWLDPGY